ncbi:MAG: hypothetical protein OXI64_00805 [Defluviicoccus sp.]|nr:hypothetical protein [Defluviicoccus sp.]
MSERDLTAGTGIARSTLRPIVKGGPSVAIGLALEAATLTGVDLFVPEATALAPQLKRTDDKLASMPGWIHRLCRDMEEAAERVGRAIAAVIGLETGRTEKRPFPGIRGAPADRLSRALD